MRLIDAAARGAFPYRGPTSAGAHDAFPIQPASGPPGMPPDDS